MFENKPGLFRLLLAVGFFLLFHNLFAQTADKLPPFGMTLSNGHFFKAADISRGRPILLIYFAPDCDHCHTLMNAFFKQATDFKAVEVVMVTFKPASELVAFEQAYQTSLYPNITVGTEGTTNYLRLFYKLQATPFAAFYNKEGKLISSYRKNPSLEDLLKGLKQLQTANQITK